MTTAVAERPVAVTTARTRRKGRASGMLLGLLAWLIGIIFIIPATPLRATPSGRWDT